MTIFGKDGFPVELIQNRSITNLLRILILGNIHETLKRNGWL